MAILVTGGAGFIGSNFVLDWLACSEELIVNFDKLTYAGNLENLKTVQKNKAHLFIQGDIKEEHVLVDLLTTHHIRAVIHFAAESHVDRSILGPEEFIQTNILGTFNLLQAVLQYWRGLQGSDKQQFRFIHVSTDEVFGSLHSNAPPFTELSLYKPNSPYSASKASSDHLVRAFYQTYGVPAIITHCSNNYGPYQVPEKLIPLCIHNALVGKAIPIYGNGQQIRDWLYVKDHCSALRCVLANGQVGESYNVGGSNEKTNCEVVKTICDILDSKQPRQDGRSYREQVIYVEDRPGHDWRYAIDASKIEKTLGWKSIETFISGIEKTVVWFLENRNWVVSSRSFSSDEKRDCYGTMELPYA